MNATLIVDQKNINHSKIVSEFENVFRPWQPNLMVPFTITTKCKPSFGLPTTTTSSQLVPPPFCYIYPSRHTNLTSGRSKRETFFCKEEEKKTFFRKKYLQKKTKEKSFWKKRTTFRKIGK